MEHDNYDPDKDAGIFTLKDGTPSTDGLYLVWPDSDEYGCGLLTLSNGTWRAHIVPLHIPIPPLKIRKYLGPLPQKIR